MRLARRSIFAQIKMSQKVHDLWLKNPQFMNNEQIKNKADFHEKEKLGNNVSTLFPRLIKSDPYGN